MRHTPPLTPQFYVTSEQPCPYLQGRFERKLFTALAGTNADELHDTLSSQGFRRSQNVLYRPSCSDCAACMSARISLKHFTPSKSQKRVLAKSKHLRRSMISTWASEEQYELFQKYLTGRHAHGGMADMDIFEFAAMIEESPTDTRVLEYRDGAGKLTAVALTDVLSDGLSLVYSFFDTDVPKNSLGTHIILDHIRMAQDFGLPYVYLGFWVPGSPKMHYKANFSGLELFQNGAWHSFKSEHAYDDTVHPLSIKPIARQVAELSIPPLNAVKVE